MIAYELEAESDAMFGGEIEVDESYFGGTRKGKRGRRAARKIPVFGLLKRGGKVYTRVIPDPAMRLISAHSSTSASSIILSRLVAI